MKNKFYSQILEYPARIKHLATLGKVFIGFLHQAYNIFQEEVVGETERLMRILMIFIDVFIY